MISQKIQDRLGKWAPRFSPGLFKAFLVVVVASAFAVPLAIVALPYLEILNDMAVQPKAKTQGHYGWFQGETIDVERAPVEGTMPMDHFPYHLEGKDEKTADIAAEILKNPVTPTLEILEEGRKLYEYYCWTCHGRTGVGDGPIIGPDLFPAPPSLHTDTALKLEDGRIYHIICRGQNTMPGYIDKFTPAERWAIIHYVRALQRSQNPKPEDLEK